MRYSGVIMGASDGIGLVSAAVEVVANNKTNKPIHKVTLIQESMALSFSKLAEAGLK